MVGLELAGMVALLTCGRSAKRAILKASSSLSAARSRSNLFMPPAVAVN